MFALDSFHCSSDYLNTFLSIFFFVFNVSSSIAIYSAFVFDISDENSFGGLLQRLFRNIFLPRQVTQAKLPET